MSFVDLATLAVHRRHEMETRVKTFHVKCDETISKIKRLKEQASGMVQALNCGPLEMKERYLHCVFQLEDLNYLLTDMDHALVSKLGDTSTTESTPNQESSSKCLMPTIIHNAPTSNHESPSTIVHKVSASLATMLDTSSSGTIHHQPAPTVSHNEPFNIMDVLSEPAPSTSAACKNYCVAERPKKERKLPKDEQLIVFSSSSSESMPMKNEDSRNGEKNGSGWWKPKDHNEKEVPEDAAQQDGSECQSSSCSVTECFEELPAQSMLVQDEEYQGTIISADGFNLWIIVEDLSKMVVVNWCRMVSAMSDYHNSESRGALTLDQAKALTYCGYYDDDTQFWYRGLLIGIDEITKIAQVYLVDTGEARSGGLDTLRPLAPAYATQAPYARCCHLAQVEMKSDDSLRERQHKFLQQFIGQFCRIRVDDNTSESLGVSVTLPNGSSLEDLMVKDGLAYRIDNPAQSAAGSTVSTYSSIPTPQGVTTPASTYSPVPAAFSSSETSSRTTLPTNGPSSTTLPIFGPTDTSRSTLPTNIPLETPFRTFTAPGASPSTPLPTPAASGVSSSTSLSTFAAPETSKCTPLPTFAVPGTSSSTPLPTSGPPEMNLTESELQLFEIDTPEYEDPLEAVTGYSCRDEAEICKHYKGGPEKTCFKGAHCTKRHVLHDPEGYTLDKVEAVALVESLPLPAPDTWLRVLVTYVLHLDRLYVQLLNDQQEAERETPRFGVLCAPTTLDELVMDMNSPAQRVEYKPFTLTPAVGELVAAVYPMDNQYYRARVLAPTPADHNVEIQYIDYGNSLSVREDKLFMLPERYAALPEQAVLCRLAGVEASTADSRQWAAAKKALSDLVLEHTLDAHVIQREYDKITVELFDQNGVSIAEELANKKLVKLGHFEVVDDTQDLHQLVP